MSNEDNNCQAQLPLKDVPIELQQKVVDLGGKPDINLYKVLANNPTLLSSWIDFAYSLRSNCTHIKTTSEELDKQLKQYFTEAEYLELILTGSFYVMGPTVLKALRIQAES
ncbi:unnamed protein product [Rotaria magnacalcarata]|uniref:Uncharacterized protein n=1 Tax=Rotaria magnacalcarata TaxID=392030 RepID=A0A8S2R2C0_9BILA|nr:unnamed protein product [Rotaria magnacalcarata]